MDRRHAELTTIATLCFGVVVLIYRLLDAHLAALSSVALLKQVVLYFTSIGFYVFLFKASTFLYDKYLFKLIRKSEHLEGAWFYIQRIGADESIRVGVAEIEYVNGVPMVSGTGERYPGNIFSNRWHSETVSYSNRQIIWSFESTGPRKEHIVRKGIILASTQGHPPGIIYGYWADIAPAGASGTISFYKNQAQFHEDLSKLKTGL